MIFMMYLLTFVPTIKVTVVEKNGFSSFSSYMENALMITELSYLLRSKLALKVASLTFTCTFCDYYAYILPTLLNMYVKVGVFLMHLSTDF